MRQWMCDPRFLCQKHLLGEHVEHHMFIGTLKRKISINGYIQNDLLEPLSLQIRHDALVHELVNRGMNHFTLLDFDVSILDYLNESQINHKIDRNNSLYLLLSRCSKCQERYDYYYYEALKNGEIK